MAEQGFLWAGPRHYIQVQPVQASPQVVLSHVPVVQHVLVPIAGGAQVPLIRPVATASGGSRGSSSSKPAVLSLAESLFGETHQLSSGVYEMPEIVASIETLYEDQLKPYGRILRKRLAERAAARGSGGADVDPQRLRETCGACPLLSVQEEKGGDWAVLLRSRVESFINVYSTEDPYPAQLWREAAAFFEGPEGATLVLPGGRYSCARALTSLNLRFLQGYSLGRVCHILQLAISQKKLLGYHAGAVVPYGRSQSMEKERCASHQQPCNFKAVRRRGVVELASLDDLKSGLAGIFTKNPARIQLSNIKRLFRSRYHMELSETALGYSKLSDLLQDASLQDVCSLSLGPNGYEVVPFREGGMSSDSIGRSLRERAPWVEKLTLEDEVETLQEAEEGSPAGVQTSGRQSTRFRSPSHATHLSWNGDAPIMTPSPSACYRGRSFPACSSQWSREDAMPMELPSRKGSPKALPVPTAFGPGNRLMSAAAAAADVECFRAKSQEPSVERAIAAAPWRRRRGRAPESSA
eukprot:TRINITY_DN26410_c0_g1_i1.p1 TRINITY_DN26410_c0_g1~~TRINITY_DN26410_c0_g1_i1.p1  ORF type:complete len:541 (+),score=106.54 TRINITY_DN26410_c0_g1_i1:52-1623(+)